MFRQADILPSGLSGLGPPSMGSNTISRQWIEEMAASTSLADVLEGVYGVPLEESRGDWDYKCSCPLPGHIDNTPSFGVNSKKGVFKCLGCGQSGGVLMLVRIMEGLSFREAVFRLAEITGVGEGGDESQILRAMRGIKGAVDDYLEGGESETLLPCGMGLAPFLTAMTLRMRDYEVKVDSVPEEIAWVDAVYQRLDRALESQGGPDERSMARLWRGLSKEIIGRLSDVRKIVTVADHDDSV